MKGLSPQQAKTLRFLEDFIALEGWTPTLEEICEGIGVSSKSTARAHVEALARKGFIELGPRYQRTRRMRVVA